MGLLTAGLALLVLAWGGLLQGFTPKGRRVAWGVQPDPSLQHVAETLHRWHRDGRLDSGRVFATHPDVAHYCTWFCPEQKGFLDHRLPLFSQAAGDYEAVCRELLPSLDANVGQTYGLPFLPGRPKRPRNFGQASGLPFPPRAGRGLPHARQLPAGLPQAWHRWPRPLRRRSRHLLPALSRLDGAAERGRQPPWTARR